jgi:lipopolysaccharide export system permease protein
VENTRIWLTRPKEEAFQYYLNYIPYMIYLILPAALLLASVFSVGIMSRHLEIVAMKSSGVSIYRILFPLVFIGALISWGMFHFGDSILADSNHKRFKIKEPRAPESKSGNPSEKYKFVYIGPQKTTYFFQHYSGSNKKGRDVTILMEQMDTLYQRYDCKKMYWENHWVLLNGIHRIFEKGNVVAEHFDRRDLLELRDTPEDLVNNRIFPDEMRLKELERRISILKRSGEPTRRFETQWHFKISGCAVNFIMIIIGISLTANTFGIGLTIRVGIAILALIGYIVLVRFGLAFGENGELSPVTAAWLGNGVFGLFGLILFWRIGRQ